MGSVGQPEFVEIGVTIFTSAFQMRGKLHVLGVMQTFINDEQKPTFTLHNAEVLGTSATNPVKMSQHEVIISKRSIQCLLFDVMPPQGSMAMLPRQETIVAYVEGFAISARFFMGQDARLADFSDASMQQFLTAGDLKLYPMGQMRQGLVNSAPLGVVHKSAFKFYHKA
jgi:hypothetical protein